MKRLKTQMRVAVFLTISIYAQNGALSQSNVNMPGSDEDFGDRSSDASRFLFHLDLLKKQKHAIHTCLDSNYNAVYRCKSVEYEDPKDRDDDDYSVPLQAKRAYLPPFPPALPSIGYRRRLSEYQALTNSYGDRYTALLPLAFIKSGEAAFDKWQRLAQNKSLFGCVGVQCNLIRPVIDDPDQRPDDAPLDQSSVSTEDQKIMAGSLELCTVYLIDGTGSPPFNCTFIAVVDEHGNKYIAVPIYQVRDYSDISATYEGGNEIADPQPMLEVETAGRLSREQLNNMIKNALTSYSAKLIPGGSLVLYRRYLPSQMFLSIWGTSSVYENAWLRFDCEPSERPGVLVVFLYLVLEHSKERDPAPEHWHPATIPEIDEYSQAIEELIKNKIPLRKCGSPTNKKEPCLY